MRIVPQLTAICCAAFVFAMLQPAFAQDGKKDAAKKKPSAKAKNSKKEDNGEHLRIIGRPVLVTKSGAELKTRKGVVWRAYLGEVFTVAEVKDDWYWIREKGGWLWKEQTIPLDLAVEHYSREITAKETAEAYHQRGIAYAAIQDYKNAIADYTKTIEMKPQYAGAYVNRGNAHRELKDAKKAMADYSAAITLDPKNFVALNNRGLIHTENRKFDNALADYNKALSLQKDYAEAFNNRGVVWREKGDYKKAIQDYTTAIKIYPKYWVAFGNRGFAAKKLGLYDKALADYSQAALLKPFEPKALNDFAWVLATCPDDKFRNGKSALKDAVKACELTKQADWNCLDTLGAAHAEIGDFDKAIRAAEKALKLAPKASKDAVRSRIELYADSKPYRET